MIFIINIRLGDLTMLHHIKKLFGIKPKAVEAEAPYKVEVSTVADQATQAVVESMAPAKKKPAVKKASAAKQPRAPKKPKVI
jgi:hypothetical protein